MDDVEDEGIDGFVGFIGDVGFGVGVGIVGVVVVVRGWRFVVVVIEFDDDDVIGFDEVGGGLEVVFVLVWVSGLVVDGLVDNG